MPLPDKHDPATVGERTWSVHGGNAVDASGALRTPLVLANSYLLPEDASQLTMVGSRFPRLRPGAGTSTSTRWRPHSPRWTAVTKRWCSPAGSPPCTRCSSRTCAGDHAIVSAVTYEAVWSFQRYGHLRLAVGLEEPDDLIADIHAALDTALPA